MLRGGDFSGIRVKMIWPVIKNKNELNVFSHKTEKNLLL